MRTLILAGLMVVAVAGAGSAATGQLLRHDDEDATAMRFDVLGRCDPLTVEGIT